MKWSIQKTIITGFSLVLILLSVVTALSQWNTKRLIENGLWKTHTYKVLQELEGLLSQIKDIELGKRAYVISGQEFYLEPYNRATQKIQGKVKLIKELTADNPSQQQRLQELSLLIDEILTLSRQNIELRKKEKFDEKIYLPMIANGKHIMDQIREAVATMQNEEGVLLTVRSRAEAESILETTIIIGLCNILAILLIPLTVLLINRELNERKKLEKVLTTSEARFHGIIDVAQEAIICINQEQEIILFNRGAEQIFSYRSEEVMGRAFVFLLPEIRQNIYSKYINKFVDYNPKSYKQVENWGKIQLKKKNGQEFIAEASISKIKVDEQLTITVVLRDITL